jgi:hypothetical protein
MLRNAVAGFKVVQPYIERLQGYGVQAGGVQQWEMGYAAGGSGGVERLSGGGGRPRESSGY